MSKQLLLIDDDEDEKMIFCDALETIGSNYNCVYAKSSVQAIQMLEIVCPEIVFVDLNMPGINGLDCIKLLRNMPLQHKLPIILYSTGLDDGVIKQAERNGVSACVEKPCTFSGVKATLHNLIQTFANRETNVEL